MKYWVEKLFTYIGTNNQNENEKVTSENQI
jgi:hypothetical protein